MAEILNFNKARKARAKAQAAAKAAENRAKHGRTKEQKRLERTEAEEMTRKLEGVRREVVTNEDPPPSL